MTCLKGFILFYFINIIISQEIEHKLPFNNIDLGPNNNTCFINNYQFLIILGVSVLLNIIFIVVYCINACITYQYNKSHTKGFGIVLSDNEDDFSDSDVELNASEINDNNDNENNINNNNNKNIQNNINNNKSPNNDMDLQLTKLNDTPNPHNLQEIDVLSVRE